ncbi:hypothetical protein GM415_15435 [Pseudodesulfovibrio cashew]|uniref:Uncharacterized protein n=1 Tax=Pseudodesulfovibrio cashew TaxID=2678688 RepID=A0A6I6JJX9_9BACT|nr:hypothetical protein [Pseudodesulfovibrio cashew]QGY41449.1 hypothetical protein GM415_15435 [Pseudodesulfovibrio cashew]
MKKLTTLTMALALTLLVSGFAFAMQGMDHSAMKAGDMSMQDSMKVINDNIAMMKADVETMKDAGQRKAAMGAMNKHMTNMHHGMAGVEAHAKANHDTMMEDSMKQLNKDMMVTMKGMGMMKKDADKGISMMEEGIAKMEKAMHSVKGMK